LGEVEGAGGGLPTGTVTFVLGDVVGSTRVWEDHADAMPEALAKLDELIDTGVTAHGGARPAEQGERDSFVAAFARAADAVRFSVALQTALGEDGWPDGTRVALRMALHTGEAQLRDGTRYMGEPLNRCARVRQLGHGGQVLLSSVTADLVVDQLRDGVFLRDLGVHHLRDLTRPERVSQLCAPGLPFDFPPLRSLDRLPNNLPVLVTSFVGRATELAETSGLLAERRMVTLTGAGGCGKTRLAIQLGADIVDRFPDGVWMADLARLSDPDLVPKAVADAVDVAELPGQPILDTVVDHLHDREALLIVDNCEHMLDASVDVVEPLLQACPGVRVLATSREPLGAEGEATYRVPSLTLPAHDRDADCSSVRLFADRAALARPQLRIGPDNLGAVTAICARLDGIPLAIELAAARCRALTPTQIAAQLADRFGLLTGGRRGGLPRQRTLEASVDWSYGLLEEDERLLLRRLSVFAGGFTLEAAGAVCADEAVQLPRVLDLVTGLVDKSLVQAEGDETSPRYRLLETIRDYARSKLIDAGEVADARQRHAEYFVDLAETCGPGLLGPHMLQWLARLNPEIDNVRAADDYAAETGQADLALRLGGPLRLFWGRGYLSEGAQRLSRALGLPGGAPARRGRAMLALSECVFFFFDQEALTAWVEEALRIAGQQDDRELNGELLAASGWMTFVCGKDDAPRLLQEGVEYLRNAGTEYWGDPGARYWLVDGLWGAAMAAIYAGDPEAARRHGGEAVSLSRALGNPMALGRSLAILAAEAIFEGDLDQAAKMLTEARPLLVETGDDTFRSHVDFSLAWIEGARGNAAGALAMIDTVLAEARRLQQAWAVAWILWVRLLIESRNGRPGEPLPSLEEAEVTTESERIAWATAWARAIRAEHLVAVGDVASARRSARTAVQVAESTIYGGRARGRARLALARVTRAEGDAAGAEDIAHQALAALAAASMRPEVVEALEFLAALAAEQGSPAEAVRIFAAAAAARDQLGCPVPPIEAGRLEDDIQLARGASDPAASDSAWAEGASMSLDDAVAYASRGRGERKRPSTGWASLTPAERDVIRLVAEGLRNADIADRLFVSPATVKTHLAHVFTKLGVSTRAELAVLASRRG
jgi:predicted ATPase/class 3 adenylate cyclase/DNA-binding CsgD family transcriptional regulator